VTCVKCGSGNLTVGLKLERPWNARNNGYFPSFAASFEANILAKAFAVTYNGITLIAESFAQDPEAEAALPCPTESPTSAPTADPTPSAPTADPTPSAPTSAPTPSPTQQPTSPTAAPTGVDIIIMFVPGDLDSMSSSDQTALTDAVRTTLTTDPLLLVAAKDILNITLSSGSIAIEIKLTAGTTTGNADDVPVDRRIGDMLAGGNFTIVVDGKSITPTAATATSTVAGGVVSTSKTDNTGIIIGVVIALVLVLVIVVIAILAASKNTAEAKVAPLAEVAPYPTEPETKEENNDSLAKNIANIIVEKDAPGELRGTHNEERWVSRESRAKIAPSKNTNRNAWKEADREKSVKTSDGTDARLSTIISIDQTETNTTEIKQE